MQSNRPLKQGANTLYQQRYAGYQIGNSLMIENQTPKDIVNIIINDYIEGGIVLTVEAIVKLQCTLLQDSEVWIQTLRSTSLNH